jgi:hypothetical protein
MPVAQHAVLARRHHRQPYSVGSVHGTDQDRLQYPAVYWSVPCTRVDYTIKPRARH